jgi:hypothetical protein
MSASTRHKRQQHTLLEKKGRGLGYFGDDNDKIRDAKEKSKYEKSLKVPENEKNTDANGRVTFTDLPIG